MEIKNLTYEGYQSLVANPQENALVFWFAEWSAPAQVYLNNLIKSPDIPDLTVYKIDIENPPIDIESLLKIDVDRIPYSFFIEKGKAGITRKYAGCMDFDKLTKFVK